MEVLPILFSVISALGVFFVVLKYFSDPYAQNTHLARKCHRLSILLEQRINLAQDRNQEVVTLLYFRDELVQLSVWYNILFWPNWRKHKLVDLKDKLEALCDQVGVSFRFRGSVDCAIPMPDALDAGPVHSQTLHFPRNEPPFNWPPPPASVPPPPPGYPNLRLPIDLQESANVTFSYADDTNIGFLDMRGFMKAVQKFGRDIDERGYLEYTEMIEYFRRADTDQNGVISRDEYVRFCVDTLRILLGQRQYFEMHTESRAHAVFSDVDTDKDGQIGFKDFKLATLTFGMQFNYGENLRYFEAADVNKNGSISEEEFVSLCKSEFVKILQNSPSLPSTTYQSQPHHHWIVPQQPMQQFWYPVGLTSQDYLANLNANQQPFSR